MAPDDRAGGDLTTARMAFQTTHWSVVLRARALDGDAARQALASLCSVYWYPIYAFIRRRGAASHDAEDLTQEFFCQFLEKNSLGKVSPQAGRFRSFLLACLKHFLAHEREKAQAQRRGGGRATIPLDSAEAESRYLQEPADNATPERMFEKRWALTVLGGALEDLRQEYVQCEKSDLFEDLRGCLPGGQGGPSRAELAAKRGVGVNAIDVAIHRLRRRFGALLRERVAQTVATDSEVDEEIRYLASVIGS
jgi:RNA polymerase sigma factor (sigma-70 family)